MRKVVFVNRYFSPDHSATSQIASDLAFHLASRNWEVVAITSRQRYDDARARLPAIEVHRGVRIVRVWSTRFGRGGLVGRAIDYVTFYASAFFAIRRHARAPGPAARGTAGRRPAPQSAVVVAMTDPPLMSVIAAAASRRNVNWVQDLFPEVAEGLGMRVPRFVRALRDWSLRRARANVVLGEQMAARVPKSVIIHNWADASLTPIARDDNALRRDWNLGEAFVAAYSGNLGRAHEFDTILGAMARLPEVRLLIIGGGARLAAVQHDVKRDRGSNVTFLPYQPRELLSRSLSAADVHLVSLQPQLEGLIVPSKFYGVLAVGRPVIFIGAREGEVARIIDETRCGIVVAPGDVDALANALRTMADDPHATAEMGRRGLDAYRARFAPSHAFAAWERTLEEAAS